MNLKINSFLQEFQISSTNDGRLSWIAGLYYFKETSPYYDVDLRFKNTDGTDAFVFSARSQNHTQVYAVFGQAEYDLTDQLSVILGVRYSDEKKDETVKFLNNFVGGAPFFQEESWDSVTPKVVLNYQYDDDTFFYASVSEGFKSGGYNMFDAEPAFDPESVIAYEIGSKITTSGGRLRLNAAAFYNDFTNLQVQSFDEGVISFSNAVKAGNLWSRI